jgi:MAF protein
VVDIPDIQAGNLRQPQILGKPVDAREAAAMLQQLRGRIHQVITAVAVYRPADGRIVSDLCITDVKMRAYTEDEILAYVATGDPLDKAGAYAIQHAGFDPVESLQGCFANVVGLPLCILNRSLVLFDLELPFEIPNSGDHATCLFCRRVMHENL